MRRAFVGLALVAIAAASRTGAASPFDERPVVRALSDELARSFDKLEMTGFGKPYFLSYLLFDWQRAFASASFGALEHSSSVPHRTVDIDLRVGDYAFDNSNTTDSDRGRSITLPADADYDAVRRALWLATDREYKHAVEVLERKRAVAKAEAKPTDEAASFSKEPPSHVVDDHPPAAIDLARVEAIAKQMSAVFRGNHDVYGSRVTISALSGKIYFVSSEGSTSVQTVSGVRVVVECSTQADDGMMLHDSLAFYADTIDQLPPVAELVAQVEKLSKELSALRVAPVVDDAAGPVLFTGIAAGQVVRALLAEELAGTPPPKADRPGGHAADDSELAGKIGQRVLPAGVTVVDDPTARRSGTTALAGWTPFDAEGVPGQKVVLVENGMFVRFLMSRIPRKGFERSNGHANSSPFSPVRAHPANLLISSSRGLSDAAIRARAIADARSQGVKYIFVVEKLHTSGDGDTPSNGDGPPPPEVIKRVSLDGREELVRGASFGPVPVRTLKDLLAVGAKPTVYTYIGSGLRGRMAQFDAPSGYFVSIAAPSLLFHDLDVKKPRSPHRRAPIAPRPR